MNDCRDYIPKLCQKELINAIEEFIEHKLGDRIRNKGFTIDELVDSDPNEEERKSLINRKKLFEETLKTMNKIMDSIDFKVLTKIKSYILKALLNIALMKLQ